MDKLNFEGFETEFSAKIITIQNTKRVLKSMTKNEFSVIDIPLENL